MTVAERTAFTGRRAGGAADLSEQLCVLPSTERRGHQGVGAVVGGNGAVLADGPEDVIRVILGGIEAQEAMRRCRPSGPG